MLSPGGQRGTRGGQGAGGDRSSEAPRLRGRGVAERLRDTNPKQGQTEKETSALLKKPKLVQFEGPRGTAQAQPLRQGAAGWALTPSTPKAREGDIPTPGSGGQGTGRYRQVRGGLPGAPHNRAGSTEQPPGGGLALGTGHGGRRGVGRVLELQQQLAALQGGTLGTEGAGSCHLDRSPVGTGGPRATRGVEGGPTSSPSSPAWP